jgi:hypothetical protein
MVKANTKTNDTIAQHITALVAKFQKLHGYPTAWDINCGGCEDFAKELQSLIGGELTDLDVLFINDPRFQPKGFNTWSKEKQEDWCTWKSEYHPRYPTNHTVLELNNRFYDSQDPYGVSDWTRLHVCRRVPRSTYLKAIELAPKLTFFPKKKERTLDIGRAFHLPEIGEGIILPNFTTRHAQILTLGVRTPRQSHGRLLLHVLRQHFETLEVFDVGTLWNEGRFRFWRKMAKESLVNTLYLDHQNKPIFHNGAYTTHFFQTRHTLH